MTRPSAPVALVLSSPSLAHRAEDGSKNWQQQAPLAAPQVSQISVVLRVSIIVCGGLGLYSQFVIDLLNQIPVKYPPKPLAHSTLPLQSCIMEGENCWYEFSENLGPL